MANIPPSLKFPPFLPSTLAISCFYGFINYPGNGSATTVCISVFVLETTEFFIERGAGLDSCVDVKMSRALFWTVTKGGLEVYEAPGA